MSSVMYVSGNKVKLAKVPTNSPNMRTYVVQLSICQFLVEWKVIYDKSLLDVIPILESFNSIECDAYKPIDTVFSLPPSGSIKDIAAALVQSLLESQASQLQRIQDNRLDFVIDMVQNIDNCTILKLRNQVHDVLIQYPLPLSNEEGDIEYLATILHDSSIHVSLQISLGTHMKVTASVTFPPTMTATKQLALPSYDASDTPLDFNVRLRDAIVQTWGRRKAFIEAFQSFAAVLEYDAVDFAFLSYTVRVTHQKMYMVCVTEVRLAAGFPDAEPLVMLHFLQQSHSVPLENVYARIKHSKSWSVDKIAKEIFCVVYKWIDETAFSNTM